MTEVILNDECMHCNNRECHDGEHFCNQAMKENSFYKNARLYKGLEVIKSPTYEELEKENAELKLFKQDCIRLTEDNVVMARQRAETARQLTKAKELLKQWLQTSKASGCDNINIVTDTEQFLK